VTLYWRIIYELSAFDILLHIMFARVLFAALALSLLILLIIFARKNNLAPTIRSYLWMLCIPALFIPFERSFVFFRQGQVLDVFAVFPSFMFFEHFPILYFSPSYIWLTGFIVCVIRVHRERKKMIRLLKAGKIGSCAAYYHKGRSHIYTPPNFETAYTSEEKAILLSHEKQHIKQGDPLIFLFLQGVQCVFWFNPLVHKAVQYIRHDRELLCDERVTPDCSKFDYGMLLLSEAQRALPAYPLVGIASQPAGIYERVVACTRPFSKNKRAAVAVTWVAVFLFAVGAVGFTKPIVYHPMETMIFLTDDLGVINPTHIEGFEPFIFSQQDGIVINQGFYQHAIAEGLEADGNFYLCVIYARRPSLLSISTISCGFKFTVSDLNDGDMFFSVHEDERFSLRNFWGVLYRIL
jgi:beta-lactamase regulating signal transducer with metallopeptidase domain